ncbi:chromosomal replication initiator protein DnaA [Rhodobacteraceae bacterium N5(2021)]|uniref:Chromosomal replication initiator protein DnaA n=1 Tax=Gymnodinialimonas phycosphaerae TaxID=2841589 RepID=A0A975TT13_9RHOB|nr:chromosomal replication initiator protein DnaA [Gymnodinialimonas phycosphaerae]MBY4894086.1 chromosomal replication initiator protein DnaA [Gymnodinialimonas phycosphaerae]
MTNETWDEVRQELLKAVGKNNFSAWIEPIAFDRVDERTAHFHVPTNFIGSWVTNNFGDLILRQLSAHGAGADRVKFTVAPRGNVADVPANTMAPAASTPQAATPQPAAASAPAPVQQPAPVAAPQPQHPRELPGAKLNPNFTFANFVVGKPNELAHAAARRVAETLDVTFNPLFLYGGVGLGKTHLMHAIAWDLQDRFPDAKILYLSAEQFMHRFVRALREQDTFNFKETFRSVDILMVDDVQFIAGKTSTQQEFFHTFNALVEMGKQIVISGDRAPVDMEELDNRIASRLQCGLVVDIHPTDYELRLGVLQHKAEILGAKYPHIKFADGVLEYLAQKISTNVRVLEGALTRLFAFADLVRREVTVDLAKECLTDVLRATDKKVTMDEILKKTCEYYKIRQVDMISQNRQRVIARPRQMAMYLCKRLTTRSLPEIGKKFGGRDHTTILYGVRKIEELMQADSQIAEDAELLRRMLEA